MKHYDEVSEQDRKLVPFEAYALKAGLDLAHLLGAVLMAIRSRSVSAVKMMSLVAHPAITEATVKSALKESGVTGPADPAHRVGISAHGKGRAVDQCEPGTRG